MEQLRTELKASLLALGLPELDFTLEYPSDLTRGDWTTNAALLAASRLKCSPREAAERIIENLTPIPGVERIEIAGPGFINFWLRREVLKDTLARVIDEGDRWGGGTSWGGKRVVVEYTDPNPFKEFHIGHLFTNAVGESLARLFAAAGAEVIRACYQGDVGLHVAQAIWGMQKLGIDPTRATAKDLGRAYASGATALKEDERAAAEIRALNVMIYERSDPTINALYDSGRKLSLDYFEEIYRMVGTKFDAYFFESEVAAAGKELVLAHPDVFRESEGARVFVGEEYGLHTRVFLNAAGLPTYEAKELALAEEKHRRLSGYDHSVVSTAKEINEYFKVLLAAMRLVYPELAEKTEHVGHGMVRLKSGKMSSRTGEVIAALDFIDEVKAAARARIIAAGVAEPTQELVEAIAIGAIKFATLKSNIAQDSIFDSEAALSFEGDSGPYLQYTHARIMSVLEKAARVGVVADPANPPPSAYECERLIARFPVVLEEALRARSPHGVAKYLLELAAAFNRFYATEKIADPAEEYALYKVALATAVGLTIKNGLNILGIEAPTRM